MNIYSNIINRYFDYKGQEWIVVSQVKECEKRMASNTGLPRCRNAKTGEVVKFGYEEFWNVTARGYSHNGITEGV